MEEIVKYRSIGNHLKSKYGEKIYKLSLSCSDSCPNRDGSCGRGGCIFCAEGSGAFAESYWDPVDVQIEKAKQRIAAKSDCKRFIAYFQSYTSTYGDKNHIKECLLAAAHHPDIVELSVATRPDCLGEDIMELLQEVNKIKPVTVELGLQTAHETTARLINRGYPLAVFEEAMERLKTAGLLVVVHIILYLPGETEEMMLDTVRYVVNSGAGGIKLQLLHVLEGTPLAEMYKSGEVPLPELPQYVALLKKCVKQIPESVIIHRLTGDGDKRLLIAPLWSGNKRLILNAISQHLKPI